MIKFIFAIVLLAAVAGFVYVGVTDNGGKADAAKTAVVDWAGSTADTAVGKAKTVAKDAKDATVDKAKTVAKGVAQEAKGAARDAAQAVADGLK